MGLPDFYPFVLSKSSVSKLHFVHRLVRAQSSTAQEKETPIDGS